MFVDMVFFAFNRLWPFLFPNKKASESKKDFCDFIEELFSQQIKDAFMGLLSDQKF